MLQMRNTVSVEVDQITVTDRWEAAAVNPAIASLDEKKSASDVAVILLPMVRHASAVLL
jgi:hypothetical protein